MRPEGLQRHKRRNKDVETTTIESERVLHTVQRNLENLTHQVLMEVVEDLPEAIQRRVVGVP